MPTDGSTFCKLPHWLLHRGDLIIEAKVIWAYLMDRQGNNGSAYPGQRTISRDCHIHPRNVVKALEQLAKANLITITKPTPKEAAKGKTSRYQCGSASIVEAASAVGNGSASSVETEALPPLETKSDPYNHTKQPDPVRRLADAARSEAASVFGHPDPAERNGAAFPCEDEPDNTPVDPLIQAMAALIGRSPAQFKGSDNNKVAKLLEDGFPRTRLTTIFVEAKSNGLTFTGAIFQAWEEIKQEGAIAGKQAAKAKGREPPKYELSPELAEEYERQAKLEQKRAAQ